MKTKLVIFGITGDLSQRKLLPALDAIIKTGDFNDLEIIGVSRRNVTADELVESAELASRLSVFSMDMAKSEEYARLKEHLALSQDDQVLIYLSVPPMAVAPIVDFLGEAELNSANVKLLFEKPFGVDLASAHEAIERTARYFDESQVYRIDHYLAKEMAQNIVTLRGGNALFSQLWNGAAIEKIEILALEKIGIEGRAGFYEQTGALRDVLQGHLMQLLALVLMEIPEQFDWNELPELRLAALEKIQQVDPRKALRAQYDSYQEEVKNPGSLTETFVSLDLSSRDERWQNVPLVLTTGKALDQKTTEVRIHLRKLHEAQSNCLTLRIQPNEGVEIELFTKKPGYERNFETQRLHFNYAADQTLPDAYEQVLVDAIRVKKSLFTSGGEVLRSWEILQPLLNAWEMDNSPPRTYPSSSPTHAICSVE
jgi:glucose-6-phosphate 1-dehydrogenase